ncbi:MAG: hypothetical protein WC558_16200 [Patulibacter sp.]
MIAILKRPSVPTQASGVSPEQTQHAVRLYALGQPLTKIGKTVWTPGGAWTSSRAGAQMRDTHGRSFSPR